MKTGEGCLRLESSIRVNEERALVVFQRMISAYKNGEKIFGKDDLFPEAILPNGMERNSVEYARYLFFMNQLDHNVVSKQHYKYGRELAERNPLLFKPMGFHTFSISQLEEIIKNQLHYPFSRAAVDLKYNFDIIDNKYDGNPINIFSGIKNINKAIEKLDSFRGYGPNLSSLLLLYYIKYGFLKFEDKAYLLPKVDFHDIRISIATGIVNFEGRIHKESLVPFLRKLFSDICIRNNIDIIALDDALWIIGSHVCAERDRLLCYNECPVEDYCENLPFAHYKDGYIDCSTDVKPKQLVLKLEY